MSLLDDQIEINVNLLKAVKGLMAAMKEAHKCMNLLTERIRNLEDRVFTQEELHGKHHESN